MDLDLQESFRGETEGLLKELSGVVSRLEEEQVAFPAADLEEFAQKIDRVMGAAKTIEVMDPGHPGLLAIGKISALCKQIGYQAAKKQDPRLVPICAAFWSDSVEQIQALLGCLGDREESDKIAASFFSVLHSRLKWLADKLK